MFKIFCRTFNKALGCKLSHLLNPLDKVKFMSLFLNMNPTQDCGRWKSSRNICLGSTETIVVYMRSNLQSVQSGQRIGSNGRMAYKIERETANVKPGSSKFLSVHSPQLHGIVDLNPSLCVLDLHIETSQVRHLQTTETCAGLALWLVSWCYPGLWLADASQGRGWGDAPGQASVSSVKCPLLSSLLLSPHVGHNEQSKIEKWEESDGGGNIKCIITGCCVHVVPVSGFCQDSFVSEYSDHVTCVSFVAQSVLLPNWNVSLSTLTQFVKFEFNMTLYSHLRTNCESIQLRINFLNPALFSLQPCNVFISTH